MQNRRNFSALAILGLTHGYVCDETVCTDENLHGSLMKIDDENASNYLRVFIQAALSMLLKHNLQLLL